MSLLFSDIELRDSGQIVQKLEAMGVPYQVRGEVRSGTRYLSGGRGFRSAMLSNRVRCR